MKYIANLNCKIVDFEEIRKMLFMVGHSVECHKLESPTSSASEAFIDKCETVLT